MRPYGVNKASLPGELVSRRRYITLEWTIEMTTNIEKAEIIEEAVLTIGHADNCRPDPDRDPYVGCSCRVSLFWAYARNLKTQAN